MNTPRWLHFRPVSVHFGPVSVRYRSCFGPSLANFGPSLSQIWLNSAQLRSVFGPTLGPLFQHAQGLGEFDFDVVLGPWPIIRILTSPESVVYLFGFISSIIRRD